MYVPDRKRIVLYVCTAYLVLDFSFYASGMTSPSSLRSPLRSLAVGFSVGLILTLCFTDLRSCSRHGLDAYWYFGGVSDVVASRLMKLDSYSSQPISPISHAHLHPPSSASPTHAV